MNLQFMLYRAYENRWKILLYAIATLIGLGVILSIIHDAMESHGPHQSPAVIGLAAGVFTWLCVWGVHKAYRLNATSKWSATRHNLNEGILIALTMIFVVRPVSDYVLVPTRTDPIGVVSLHDRLVQTCGEFNAKGAVELDPETRLDRTRVGPNNEIIYTITAFRRDMRQQNIDAMMLDAKTRLKNTYRTSEKMKFFREAGVVLQYE